MQRIMLKSKIHRARVTEACLEYQGSISIDADLLQAADILVHEQVEVYNVNNGERFTTYAIEAPAGSGVVCLNGAAARKACVNDLVIICTYASLDDAECRAHRGKGVFVDSMNKIARID